MRDIAAGAPPTYRYFGLLHIDPATSSGVNLSRRRDAIDTYIRCALACQASFVRHGESFTLITNDAALVRTRAAAIADTPIDVAEMTFNPVVPRGTRFFSAHFKLDVLSAFARGDFGSHVGLVDIDCVLQKPLDLPDALSVYDISDQVEPAYGADCIRRDLEAVAGIRISTPQWFGGEFIAGPREAFAALQESIRACLPRYVSRIPELHHVGDEMVVSAAIHLASQTGLKVENVGVSGRVVRWWSAATLHRQQGLKNITSAALLHLPADKSFLARDSGRRAGTQAFLADYVRMYRLKRTALLARRWLMRLLGRPAGLVAPM